MITMMVTWEGFIPMAFYFPRAQTGMVALSEIRPRGASWWPLGSFLSCLVDLGDWPMGLEILGC